MIQKLHIPASILEPLLYMTLRCSTQVDGILAETSSVKSRNLYAVASTDGRRCSVEFLTWSMRHTSRVSYIKAHESRPVEARRSFINQRLAASNTWIFGLLQACAGIRRLDEAELYQATLLLPDLTETYAAVTLEHNHSQRAMLTKARQAYLGK